MTSRSLVAGFCMLALTAGASGQDMKKGEGQSMPNMDEMMKKWKEVSTPGAAHKQLEAMAGTWKVETKSWMAGPGSEPSVSSGTATMHMVLGGRFLQQDMTGSMMDMPFNGMGLTGYDNFKKKYVSFWIDNMSTSMATMEGEMDKDGKSCTYWGVMDEPMTGEKNKKVKYVLTMDSPDRNTFRIYDVDVYGEKDPVMEITYTRTK
jgi:hypothetical protein